MPPALQLSQLGFHGKYSRKSSIIIIVKEYHFSLISVSPPDNREDTDPDRVLAVFKFADGSEKSWKYV